LVFLSGVVSGFNVVCYALAFPGGSVLIQTPVYPRILSAPVHTHFTRDEMELTRQSNGHYTIDFDCFEATVTPRTRIFILSNPHNPVGRVFKYSELEQMVKISPQQHHNLL